MSLVAKSPLPLCSVCRTSTHPRGSMARIAQVWVCVCGNEVMRRWPWTCLMKLQPTCHMFLPLARNCTQPCAPAKLRYRSAASFDPPLQPKSECPGEWEGLREWRHLPIDRRWRWGDAGHPVHSNNTPVEDSLPSTLAECGALVLNTADPERKIAISHAAWIAYREGRLKGVGFATAPHRPARPPQPKLVPANAVPNLNESPLPKPVYMLHNLAHIELNAVDLAWDTLVRFSTIGLDPSFYTDFAHVADDESRHFGWCAQRLLELGYEYGAMDAHDMLWTSAIQTAGDLSSRLALVPMSQEARGLDAGPRLAQRLQGWGDMRTSAIVSKIAKEEKGHVAVGVSWFLRVSKMLELKPQELYRGWVNHISPQLLKGPFNHQARGEVGFQREWYDKAAWRTDLAPIGLDKEQLCALNYRLMQLLEIEENTENL